MPPAGATEARPLRAGGALPEAGRAVVAPGDNPPPVRGEPAAGHVIVLEGPFLGTGRRVPELRAVVAADREQAFAVRRELHGEDAVPVAGASNRLGPGAQVPDANHLVPAGGCQASAVRREGD